MFGIIADLLSAVFTILFPIFASYKALRTSNSSQIAPWLMYWVVMSIVLLVESWTFFIIGWFPFYSWIRLFALSYLVLPQTQGAKKLYLEYVDPFLLQHERQIEELIGEAHERAKAAGLNYLYRAIDFIREKALGLPPALTARAAAPPPSAAGPAAYAQSLFSRFNLPTTTGTGVAGPASDLYSLLSSAVTAVTSTGKGGRDPAADELSAAGLLPRSLASASRAERADYIASQREKLRVLMSALDREQVNLGLDSRDVDDDLAYGTTYNTGLRKNQSENSFENIDHEDLGASSAFDRDRNVYERRRSGRYD